VGTDVTSLRGRRATERWNRVAVADIVERMTWSFPDRTALVGWGDAVADPAFARVSYRDADRTANRLAHGLAAEGLRPGDIVLMVCENSVEAFLTKLGVAKAGMTVAPLNPSLAPDVIAELIARVEPKFAVVDAELWAGVEPAFAASGLRPSVTIEAGGRPVPGTVSFAAFLDGRPDTEPDVEIHGDDVWELLFTSGTTALPKAVMLTHTGATLTGQGFALSLTRGLRIEDELVLCSFLPMIYHIGDQAFAISTLSTGGTLVLGRRPDPAQIAAAVAGERVTAIWGGSPQLLGALAPHLGTVDATSLRVIVYGWAAMDPALLAELRRHCAPDLLVFEILGQTEAIPCHRFWPDRWPELYAATAPAQNYVGVPSPLLASTVLDPDGASLAGTPGVPGEAVYRSPAVMAGYYRDPEATAEAFRFGWFHSGDSCVYDDHGLRIMVDRYKDIVKSGGESVSSIRVEAVLGQHPAVLRAAVVGLPHDRWGEAVTAFVILRPDAVAKEDELVGWCRERLAGFETPKLVIRVDALPETVGGKVLKYRLRAEYAGAYSSQEG
jgi:acyl-CoA synthetase (AMP-forming)/AMP-acid ligase II